MKKNYLLLNLLLLINSVSFGQVINEIDSDTSVNDSSEFVEIKWTPNTTLNGLVIVFFNGSNNQSYAVFDLTGKVTDTNGFFILANPDLASDTDITFNNSILQNGPDAVALYTDKVTTFPNGTLATTTNLVDAIVYGTNDENDADLLASLGETVQYNESANNNSAEESLQLTENGTTYITKAPTFRSDNSRICMVTLNTASFSCKSNTTGNNNDPVIINIPYTGMDANITSVTTTSGGIIRGDNPANTANGVITITELLEGDSWNISLNGGDCDTVSTTGIVPATQCNPDSANCPAIGAIIINEIIQNPDAVTDSLGEWFEVYNTTETAIDLNGWIISDLGTNTHTITSSVVVPATGYMVLGINGDMETNGGVSVNYIYTGFNLTNSIDEIILTCGATIIDQVNYDDGAEFPDPSGASMNLSTTAMNSTANDIGTNWSTSKTAYGNGDLGTPGTPNDFTASVKTSEYMTFNIYPNPATEGYINIIGKNTDTVNARIYNLLGQNILNQMVRNNNLNISALASGTYLLKLYSKGNTITKKIVIR